LESAQGFSPFPGKYIIYLWQSQYFYNYCYCKSDERKNLVVDTS